MDESYMEKAPKLKIDLAISVICIATMLAMIGYILVKGRLNPGAPANQAFIFGISALLKIATYLYIGIFLVKVGVFLFGKDKNYIKSRTTPLIYDLVVILAGLLLPLIFS